MPGRRLPGNYTSGRFQSRIVFEELAYKALQFLPKRVHKTVPISVLRTPVFCICHTLYDFRKTMVMMKLQLLLFFLGLSTAVAVKPRAASPQHDHPSERPKSLISPSLLAKLNGDMSEASVVAAIPSIKVVNVEQLVPKLRQKSKRIVAKFGPYDLVGKGVS
jgi:hypothetical protein